MTATLFAALAVLLTALLAVDIVLRRRVQERLTLHEQIYRALQMGVNVWRLEDPGDPASLRLILSNPGAEQATGLPIEGVVDKTIDEVFPEAVPRGIAAQMAEVARSGIPKDMGEVAYGDARLREGIYTVYAFPLKGRCVGVAFENVTKRRLAAMEVSRRGALTEMVKAVAVAANGARRLEEALAVAVREICLLMGWEVGHALVRERDGALASAGVWHLGDPERFAGFRTVTTGLRFGPGVGVPGRALVSRGPEQLLDVEAEPSLPRWQAARDHGLLAAYAFPVLASGEVAAVLEFHATRSLILDPPVLQAMEEATAQLARLVERQQGARVRD